MIESMLDHLFDSDGLSASRMKIRYTNHSGKTFDRWIVPIRRWYGRSDYHPPNDQWFMKAWDVAKDDVRDFAISGIVDILEINI